MSILSTIGYEGAFLEDFIGTLKASDVKVLIDVRQIAASRRKGFSKTALKEALQSAGIKYIHLSGLGDPKDGRDAAKAGRFKEFLKIYRAHMKTEKFKTDFDEVLNLIENEGACLMCYERNHQECHRKLLTDKISTLISISIRHLGVREGISKRGQKIWSRPSPDSSQGIAACG